MVLDFQGISICTVSQTVYAYITRKAGILSFPKCLHSPKKTGYCVEVHGDLRAPRNKAISTAGYFLGGKRGIPGWVS